MTITTQSTFLVSGGAKGVTAQCVIALAQRHACQFILLGRSAMGEPEPTWAAGQTTEAELKQAAIRSLKSEGKKLTPAELNRAVWAVLSRREIEQTLHDVQAAGGQARYLSVDVTDGEALRTAMASLNQPINGLIHGAGVLADKPIERKSEQDFERVYNAKVSGLHHLLDGVSLEQLDYLVLFSSVAGFYGNVGQADYAIANEILNKAAHEIKRNHPTCHVVSINWGPWDGGMVTPALKQAFAERNITVIPVEVGAQLFVDELSQANQDVAQVVIGSALTATASPNRSVELRTCRTRRVIRVAENPFLQDHVIGGNPVLPAACASAWMVNLAEQRCPGYGFFKFSDFRVLKGVVFDGSQPDEFMVDMREVGHTAGEVSDWEAKIWSRTEQGKPRYHYSGQVQLVSQLPEPQTYANVRLEAQNPLDGAAFYRDKRLFHGPSFQGVERVLNLNSDRLTICCRLPQVAYETQGQFPVQTVNPYILDVQLQGLLIWGQHFLQQGCLPARAALHEQFRPIPFDTTFYVSSQIRSQTKTALIADIFAHDEAGLLYSRTIGLEVTMSGRLNAMFGES